MLRCMLSSVCLQVLLKPNYDEVVAATNTRRELPRCEKLYLEYSAPKPNVSQRLKHLRWITRKRKVHGALTRQEVRIIRLGPLYIINIDIIFRLQPNQTDTDESDFTHDSFLVYVFLNVSSSDPFYIEHTSWLCFSPGSCSVGSFCPLLSGSDNYRRHSKN